MTYSSSIGGEHATSVAGNGRDPGMKEILALAREIGLKDSVAKEIACDVQEKANAELGEYLKSN